MTKLTITGKRLLAIAVVLMLAATFLTGCKKDTDTGATTDAVTTTELDTTLADDSTAATEDDTTAAEDASGDDLTTEAEVSSENVTGTDVTTGGTTPDGSTVDATTLTTVPAAPVMPTTKAEILAAYTKVVDKVKIDMPAYVSNDWQTMSNIDLSSIIYGPASALAKSVGGLETEAESSPGNQTKGTHAKWFAMPTDSLKKGCVLTDTSKIESASCKQVGDNYVITITLIQEKDPYRDMANPASVSSWHGKLFDVIDIVEVIDYAKKIPGVDANNAYSTFKGTATLTYDPITNKCVKLDHIIDVRIFLGAKSCKVIADYHFYDFKW